MENEGIVYILTNESMPDYIKIGRTKPTAESLERRIKELDNTSAALPFECFYAAKVGDAVVVEGKMLLAFSDKRVRPNREFFLMDPAHAQAALEISGGEDMTPRDDVVVDEEAREAINKARRAPFNFRMVNLHPGTKLQFRMDKDVTCEVTGDKTVLFENQQTSLSAAAFSLQKRRGYISKTIAGPDYWLYEGETLGTRRRRLAKEREAAEAESDD